MTRRAAAAAGALLCAVPGVGHAHTSVLGLGDFYAGAFHPYLVPARLIALVALGLLLGQRSTPRVDAGLVAFVVALLFGVLCACLGVAAPPEAALLSIGALTGLLVAAAVPLPQWLSRLLAGVVGLAIGLDSAPEALTFRATAVTISGTVVGTTLGLLYLLALSTYVKKPWHRIGVRVVGSWTGASALLVLALVVAGGSKTPNAEDDAKRAAPPGSASVSTLVPTGTGHPTEGD
jgi:urease accessory protein